MKWLYSGPCWRGSVARLALCGLLLLVAGCGGGNTPLHVATGSSSPLSGTAIHGRIVDSSTQQPVANATVTVAGRSTQTGKDGTFSLSVPVGSISIQVSAAKYNPGTFNAYADSNQLTDVGDLPLSPSASGPPAPPL